MLTVSWVWYWVGVVWLCHLVIKKCIPTYLHFSCISFQTVLKSQVTCNLYDPLSTKLSLSFEYIFRKNYHLIKTTYLLSQSGFWVSVHTRSTKMAHFSIIAFDFFRSDLHTSAKLTKSLKTNANKCNFIQVFLAFFVCIPPYHVFFRLENFSFQFA